MAELSHFDEEGAARMVDVGGKPVTRRIAVARGVISMSGHAATALKEGAVRKGDVLAVARVAGIMAAKRTHELVPLCHPLALDGVELQLKVERQGVTATASVTVQGRTGAEMEALTAVSVALLTVYDMMKSVDSAMTIGNINLVSKTGGSSQRAEG
jgi:cyclic pyranopterin phosphate synthase